MSREYDFVVDLAASGECDEFIDELAEAVKVRRDYLRDKRGVENLMTLVPGTKVRLHDIRPKYLNGCTGVVAPDRANRSGDLMVDIDPIYSTGRYSRHLSIPASSLEAI